MDAIKLIIVDDHQIVRDGIKAMFIASKTIKVIGEAADGNELTQLLTKLTPDIIILDINLPGKSGVEITQEIKESNPQIKILIPLLDF